MSIKDQITNETLNEKFENPFSLVNFAIEVARQKIARGELESSNLANEILETIVEREDFLEEVIEVEETPALVKS